MTVPTALRSRQLPLCFFLEIQAAVSHNFKGGTNQVSSIFYSGGCPVTEIQLMANMPIPSQLEGMKWRKAHPISLLRSHLDTGPH